MATQEMMAAPGGVDCRFEQLYQREYSRLHTLAVRMTGSRADGEDALQTAFLSAYEAFDSFRQESTEATWLYKIVLNAAKKSVKKARRLPIVEYAEAHQLSETEVYEHLWSFGMAEDEALTTQVREACLQMFMNCMPPKYRAVYTLRSILDFSVAETAEILGIQQNTVKVNLNRAKARIQAHFEGRCTLIRPGAPCDCRVWAKYLHDTNRTSALMDIQTVRQKEKAATSEFQGELAAVLAVKSLYQTHITPVDYPVFLERVRELSKSRKLKLLRY